MTSTKSDKKHIVVVKCEQTLRFSNFVLRNQKLKKVKWQCSQNHDLTPAHVPARVCYLMGPSGVRLRG